MSIEEHIGQHQDCPPCFRLKLGSIQFQGIDAGQHRFTDKERDRDMSAYQQARRSGLQPKNVFGSAEIMAQAETKFEAEHHVVMKPSIRKEMESKIAATKEVVNS